MSFWCKVLGHRWDACRCIRCGTQREEGHRWSLAEGICEQQCQVCGKEEAVACQWHHCACKHCGSLRDKHHDWMDTSSCEQVCRICGKERASHNWQPLRRGMDQCKHCGKQHMLTPSEIEQRDEEWNAGFAPEDEA